MLLLSLNTHMYMKQLHGVLHLIYELLFTHHVHNFMHKIPAERMNHMNYRKLLRICNMLLETLS